MDEYADFLKPTQATAQRGPNIKSLAVPTPPALRAQIAYHADLEEINDKDWVARALEAFLDRTENDHELIDLHLNRPVKAHAVMQHNIPLSVHRRLEELARELNAERGGLLSKPKYTLSNLALYALNEAVRPRAL